MPTSIDLPPEILCLINLVKQGVYPSAQSSALGHDLDMNKLFNLARFHNLVPWLNQYCEISGSFDQNFTEAVAALNKIERFQNNLQYAVLAQISEELSRQNIDYAVLKGASIDHLFYRNFDTSRYADDIDILVDSTSLPRVCEVLTKLGFRPRECENIDALADFIAHHHELARIRDIGFNRRQATKDKIDLHWKVADYFTLPMSVDDVLSSGHSIDIEGVEVSCMAFNHLFVHVCVHGYIDYFFKLRYLVDVFYAMQQDQFCLKDILELAESLGVRKHVENSIEAANVVFLGDTPQSNYVKNMLSRIRQKNGFSVRSHPNKGTWSTKDRWDYFFHQLKFRSRKASLFSPLLARFKYDQRMIGTLPKNIAPILWLPLAHILGRRD